MTPTVKIINAQGKGPSPFLTINEADFNPDVHTLYEDGPAEIAAAQAAEAATKPWNNSMTRAELLDAGKRIGVDLNPRATKDDLIAELELAWEAKQAQ
jgi:hypothetical protein